jgi:4-hydroxybenzoate polyprenyltransferase
VTRVTGAPTGPPTSLGGPAAAFVRYPKLFASLIKLEHTLFALPFAYVGAFLAVDGVPSAHDFVWITVAMAGARSLAMALNRLIDAKVDAANPRTAGRELPSGSLKPWHVAVFSAASLALFLVAVYQLAPIVRWLWPIPVIGFAVYPYLKRWTWLSHLWLGLVDGLAPLGAWAAIENELPWQAWALGGAVAVWIAGFDILYALFDVEVDRAQGLRSVPARFGVAGAFFASRALHVVTVAFLVAAGLGLPVGPLYWVGVGIVAALLLYEHSLVSPRDWHRLDAAFFTTNGAISVTFFAFVLGDVLL